jgi:hypothetical protein
VTACGGLDAGDIARVRDTTGAPERARRGTALGAAVPQSGVGIGVTALEREYTDQVADEKAVQETMAAARK